MELPFFYYSGPTASGTIMLDEETSRHMVQVLRMKVGEKINLTDGNGNLFNASIVHANKKHCRVNIEETRHRGQGTRRVTIAISLLKNTTRFEWFLEKATEIGVTEIIPLICERTEKEKFRYDRMTGICISAMLQSQQCWLPVLHEPQTFKNLIIQPATSNQQPVIHKFIAHCMEGEKRSLHNMQIGTSEYSLICIGPEGDFTKREVEFALQSHFIPVSLGETRLRSETAGLVAVALCCS
jgi:16S rRNA (uracil1498-N3)-methyltransferase